MTQLISMSDFLINARARMIESVRHEKPARVEPFDQSLNEWGLDDLTCEIDQVCGERPIGWVLWDDGETPEYARHIDFYEVEWRTEAASLPTRSTIVAACEDCVLELGWD